MTQLNWNARGEREYATGVDRGVFFLLDWPGVAWRGLTKVTERRYSGKATPFYQDGVKVHNQAPAPNFRASIEAFDTPPGFDMAQGVRTNGKGLYFDSQPHAPFGFAYRTLLGSDISKPGDRYKLHLIYNAVATAGDVSRETLTNKPKAMKQSWDLECFTGGYQAAHHEFDTRRYPPGVIALLERYIYGSADSEPRLPTPAEVNTILGMRL